MKKVLIVIPAAHTWFWSQVCLTTLLRFKPADADILIVYNSPFCPADRGLELFRPTGNEFQIITNSKSNKFHASALDDALERFGDGYEYMLALETDVLILRPGWLDWYFAQLKPTDYAVGAWHHEQFINPSCTLYRGDVLRAMAKWCKKNPEPDVLRWGANWENSQLIAARQPERDYQDWYDDNVSWIAGPFAEKRGWPEGTVLKEEPSGQKKGPGWFEPSQALHHWAVENGYTYTVCPTLTTKRADGMPLQTLYGASMPDPGRQLEAIEMFGNAETAHLWGGTRALDILKHEVTCGFVGANTPFWLEREARFWKAVVPQDVQAQTLELIRKHGWHYKGAGTPDVTDRDRAAVRMVQECYARGGVVI